MLAAGDTFRAAAVEQLQIWGERNDVPVIAQATGADPAAVVFDAHAGGAGARHRRAAGRHRRAPAHAVEPDGRAEEGEARDGPRRRARAARSAAGARREPGTECAPAGAAVQRSARRHGHRADQARRHREGRHRVRDRERAAAADPLHRHRRERRGFRASSMPKRSSTRCSSARTDAGRHKNDPLRSRLQTLSERPRGAQRPVAGDRARARSCSSPATPAPASRAC